MQKLTEAFNARKEKCARHRCSCPASQFQAGRICRPAAPSGPLPPPLPAAPRLQQFRHLQHFRCQNASQVANSPFNVSTWVLKDSFSYTLYLVHVRAVPPVFVNFSSSRCFWNFRTVCAVPNAPLLLHRQWD